MRDDTQHPWPAETRRLRVHDVLIDLRYRRVVRPDGEAELPQRMFDLLLLFLAEPRRLHSRADLFARVWPGVIVEDANLSQSIWMVRKALGGSRRQWIRTVAKSGYVFEPPAAVEPEAEAADAFTADRVIPAAAPPTPADDAPPTGGPAVGNPAVLLSHPGRATAPAADDSQATVSSPAGPAMAEGAPHGAQTPSDPDEGTARTSGRGAGSGDARSGLLTRRTTGRRASRWRLATAAAVLLLAGIGGAGWWQASRAPAPVTVAATAPSPAASAPRHAFALIRVQDPAAPADTRWPAALLHAWLGWKLDSLPEVTLLTEAHLAADAQGLSPRIVFLSSGADPAHPGELVIRARYDDGGQVRHLERRGTPDRLPALADALSQELLAELVPARAGAAWPRLALDPATARRYTEGVEALERREWVASAAILGEVAANAPEFGLARFQLGRALTRLARAAPAVEQTRLALERLQPVPTDVADVLQAERLARDPQRSVEAAQAFGELAERHPDKSAYALDQARMLLRGGKYREALAILDQPRWDGQTVGHRISQRIQLAKAYLAMGDAARARRHALAAKDLATGAGEGWEQERGEALLLAAQIDSFQHQDKADLRLYEQAAHAFERGGDDMDAMLARFLAESQKPGDTTASMEALLAQARERGYRRLETQILRLVAFRHYDKGDMAAYRSRLEQALATAITAGDTYEQQLLELDLLNEDFLRGHLDDADRRLARMRDAGLQGDSAIWIAQFAAMVAANRGEFAQAEETLNEAERDARAGEGDPGGDDPGEGSAADASTAVARIACLRADVRLVQGDIGNARTAWKTCADSGQPSSIQQARLGNAGIALLSGDRATALRDLRALLAPVAAAPDGPDRWLTELSIATLLTRAGDADAATRLYRRVLPQARRSGYGWIVAIAEAGLAETAAVRGDWDAARGHLAAARAEQVADVWTLSNRLDVLDAAEILATGGDSARAMALLSAVHAKARRHRDAVTQLEIHSLLPPGMAIGDCAERCQRALMARTGMRGATLAWLTDRSGLKTTALAAHQAR